MNRLPLFLGLFMLSTNSSFSQNANRGLGIENNNVDSIGTNYALVVGISSYANINHLLFADDDAYLFAQYLITEKICARKNVIRLIDSEATAANFYKELTRLKNKLQPFDRAFIYFAGHGDVETELESGFLLPYNCESNNYSATAIDISMLERFVNAFVNKKAKVVLITDACRSGNLAGGLSGASSTMSSITRGFNNIVKILSCQPTQISQEKDYPGGGHGVFTYHLVEGLSGMADMDKDSAISLREIGFYLDKVRTETNKRQIPAVVGDPEKKIANFDEAILLALLDGKKDNSNIAVNTLVKKRGWEDSTWISNRYYNAFNAQIRKLHFIEPGDNNAYGIIVEAEKNKQPRALIEDLKLELAAVLEDEAQKWINKYLRGELGNQTAVVLSDLKKIIRFLEITESMIGESDLRFTDIDVKKIFFQSYYIYRNREMSSFDKAITDLEKANALKPNQAWINNLCGSFYRVLKKNIESESAYKNAIKISPTWSYPWLGLAVLYNLNLKKFPEAEAAYKKAVELNPYYVPAWNELGKFYVSQNKYPEAEAAYKNAVQADSSHFADSWLDLGNLYSDLKRVPEAEVAYKKAIQIDTNFAFPWNNLGNLYKSLNKLTEAETAYKKALEKFPDYIDPYYCLACIYATRNKQETSLKYLELSFKKGFDDFPGIETDPDLDSIRNTAAFKTLIKKYKK